MAIPGWNSLHPATEIAHWSHIFALCFVALMVVTEVLSFVYDNRKDSLITNAALQTAIQRQQEQKQGDERHRTELAEVQRRLEETRREQAETRKQQAPRRLTPEQQQTIIAALSPFQGQKIAIWTILGNSESKNFAIDFVSVIRAAGWDDGGGFGFSQGGGSPGPDPVGVKVIMSVDEQISSGIPPAVAAVAGTLADLHIMPREIGRDTKVVAGTIMLMVGAKPTAGAP